MLIKDKEKELNVAVVDVKFDNEMNLHVLANRLTDDSYVAWNSYFVEEMEKSYVNFYNGKYDIDIEQGMRELERRSGRYTEIFIGHNGGCMLLNNREFEELPIGIVNDKIKKLGLERLQSNNAYANVLANYMIVYKKELP